MSNDSHIRASSGKLMTIRVSDSNKVIASIEFINRLNDSNSSDVVTFITESNISYFHWVYSFYSSGFKIQFYSILYLYILIKEFKSSSIMSGEITDFIRSNEFLLNSAKFVIFFISFDFYEFKSSFDII